MLKESASLSLNAYSVADRIWWETSKTVFASIFEDQFDRLSQALPRFFFGPFFAICTWKSRDCMQ